MMSKNNWKKNEEREFYIPDLRKKIGKNWIFILCCAVICAVVFGVYKYYRDYNASKDSVNTKNTQVNEQELTTAEKEGLAYAKALENSLNEQNTYMEESKLLKINPYQENQVALQFEIHGENGEDAVGILEQCIYYIRDGSMISDILTFREVETPAQYLQELVHADVSKSAYDIYNDSSSRYFTICTIGENADDANMLADTVEQALKSYSESMLTVPGQELILLSRQDSVIYDTALEQTKNAIIANRNSQFNTLNTLISQFSQAQMAAYDENDGASLKIEEAMPSITVSINLKYIIIGFVSGIFLGCCWIIFCYLLNGKIKSCAEIEKNYDLCVYGSVKKNMKNKKQNLLERDRLLARMVLNCHRNNLEKLVFVSDNKVDPSFGKDNFFQRELEARGIKNIIVENMLGQLDIYEHMGNNDAVVVLVEADKTTYSMFDKILAFLSENTISLSGIIVIE